jgi:tetratricopeptide (TPR) repeat protein
VPSENSSSNVGEGRKEQQFDKAKLLTEVKEYASALALADSNTLLVAYLQSVPENEKQAEFVSSRISSIVSNDDELIRLTCGCFGPLDPLYAYFLLSNVLTRSLTAEQRDLALQRMVLVTKRLGKTSETLELSRFIVNTYDPTSYSYTPALLSMANTYADEGNYAEAVDCYLLRHRDVVDRGMYDVYNATRIALMYVRMENYSEARKFLNEAEANITPRSEAYMDDIAAIRRQIPNARSP